MNCRPQVSQTAKNAGAWLPEMQFTTSRAKNSNLPPKISILCCAAFDLGQQLSRMWTRFWQDQHFFLEDNQTTELTMDRGNGRKGKLARRVCRLYTEQIIRIKFMLCFLKVYWRKWLINSMLWWRLKTPNDENFLRLHPLG